MVDDQAYQALWTPAELVSITNGTIHGESPSGFDGVSIDSRSLKKGDIFVAIKGERQDGHQHIAHAFKAGAGLAIIDRNHTHIEKHQGCFLQVDDPLSALVNMAQAARLRSKAAIVAVTGSVGKTTTKEMLRLALSVCGPTHASVLSYNNHWGVPLSLARLPQSACYGVFEIGMNHSGEIAPLSQLVCPYIGIITAISESHLGHFSSLDDIALAKAEIFTGLEKNGVAILPRDTHYYDLLAAEARRAGINQLIDFGHDAQAKVRLQELILEEDGSHVVANIMGEVFHYKLNMTGLHMVSNSLAVLACVKVLGMDLTKAGAMMAQMSAPTGRGAQMSFAVRNGALRMIDESYNANPASVRAALALLKHGKNKKTTRSIAVLGDMLELGHNGPQLHADLSAQIEEYDIDLLYACGPLMAHLYEAVSAKRRGAYAENAHELLPQLLDRLQAGDVVMIKGSLGSKMGQIVEAIKTRFSPEKQAVEA